MDKCTEVLSLKVTPTIKEEYEALSEKEKKQAKQLILDKLTRYLWAVNHYDHSYYFGDNK